MIVTLQNELSDSYKIVAGKILEETLGEKLYIPTPEDLLLNRYKSPNDLLNKIIIRDKKRNNLHLKSYLKLIYIDNTKFPKNIIKNIKSINNNDDNDDNNDDLLEDNEPPLDIKDIKNISFEENGEKMVNQKNIKNLKNLNPTKYVVKKKKNSDCDKNRTQNSGDFKNLPSSSSISETKLINYTKKIDMKNIILKYTFNHLIRIYPKGKYLKNVYVKQTFFFFFFFFFSNNKIYYKKKK